MALGMFTLLIISITVSVRLFKEMSVASVAVRGQTLDWYGVYESLILYHLSIMFPDQPPRVVDESVEPISFAPHVPVAVAVVRFPVAGQDIGHYNALVLNRVEKSLVWFEPHGWSYQQDILQDTLQKIATSEGAALCAPRAFEPEHIQEEEPVCGAACLLFLKRFAGLSTIRDARTIAHGMTEQDIVEYAYAITRDAERVTGVVASHREYPHRLRLLIHPKYSLMTE